METSAKLTLLEWEQLIADFSASPEGQKKWLSIYPSSTLLDLALSAMGRERDSALKLQLAIFVEENALLLVGQQSQQNLPRVLQALKMTLSAPQESSVNPVWLRQQMMVMAVTVFIQADAILCNPLQLQALIELLLGIASRPNHGGDRGLRGIACESLRAIETAWPCVLSPCAGHLFSFVQSERSSTIQAYLLLLLTTLQNAASYLFFIPSSSTGSAPSPSLSQTPSGFSPGTSPQGVPMPFASPARLRVPPRGTVVMNSATPTRRAIAGALPVLLSTAQPLAPYTLPPIWANQSSDVPIRVFPQQELTASALREFRRAISGTLELSQLVTEAGLVELLGRLGQLMLSLGLGGSQLRHHLHFEALLHSSSPLLCHALLEVTVGAVVWMYSLLLDRHTDSFRGDQEPLVRRLVLLSQENLQQPIFRQLAVHWLIGVDLDMQDLDEKRSGSGSLLLPLASSLYPGLFEPLSLKLTKIMALAQSTSQGLLTQGTPKPDAEGGQQAYDEGWQDVAVEWAAQLLVDSLVCGEGYKHQPASSTEAILTFWTIHHFLIASSVTHRREFGPTKAGHSKEHTTVQADSRIHGVKRFQPVKFPPLPVESGSHSGVLELVKEAITSIAKSHAKLLQRLLALLNRLFDCKQHSSIGQLLLQALHERLLPGLLPSRQLPAYFGLLEQLVCNEAIPPGSVLRLLEEYVRWRGGQVERGGAARLWLRGHQVLEICRLALLSHCSSRLFEPLQRLLGYLTRAYPELEVRDVARRYIRLLSSCPGRQLRDLLFREVDLTEKNTDGNKLSHLVSFGVGSINIGEKGENFGFTVRSSIRLRRLDPLLVQHSWELVVVPTVDNDLWGSEVGEVTAAYNEREMKGMKGKEGKSDEIEREFLGREETEQEKTARIEARRKLEPENEEVSLPKQFPNDFQNMTVDEYGEREGQNVTLALEDPVESVIGGGERQPQLDSQTREMVAFLQSYFTRLRSVGDERRKIKLPCTLRYVDSRAASQSGEGDTVGEGGTEVGEGSTDVGEDMGTYNVGGHNAKAGGYNGQSNGEEVVVGEEKGPGNTTEVKGEVNPETGDSMPELTPSEKIEGERVAGEEVGGERVFWDQGPAIYAAVLHFRCSNLYAPVPPIHVPYLIRETVDEDIHYKSDEKEGRNTGREDGKLQVVKALPREAREEVAEIPKIVDDGDGEGGGGGMRRRPRNEDHRSTVPSEGRTDPRAKATEDDTPRKRGRREMIDEENEREKGKPVVGSESSDNKRNQSVRLEQGTGALGGKESGEERGEKGDSLEESTPRKLRNPVGGKGGEEESVSKQQCFSDGGGKQYVANGLESDFQQAAEVGREEREEREEEVKKDSSEISKSLNSVMMELKPLQPVPALVMASIVFTDGGGNTIEGVLDSIPVGIEDLFLPSTALGLSFEAGKDNELRFQERLFKTLWELCSSSGKGSLAQALAMEVQVRTPGGVGEGEGEIFSQNNSLNSTEVSRLLSSCSESVKLLDVSAERVVEVVEDRLAPFVMVVEGGALVHIVRKGGILNNVVWKEENSTTFRGRNSVPQQRSSGASNATAGERQTDGTDGRKRGTGRESETVKERETVRETVRGRELALQLVGFNWEERVSIVGERVNDQSEEDILGISKKSGREVGGRSGDSLGLGSFELLMFLPPRYHLLMRLEVSDWSTTARIRTDYWPCLVHVDEYLEALTGFVAS